jgi:NADP-dependent 3-hydroxy acid dehydrogenase YdfG
MLSKKGSLPLLSELLSLQNKTALITGSGSGIGEAIAYRFAEAGANLELVDIDEEKLKKVKGDLQQFKVKVDFKKNDLSRKEEHRRFVAVVGWKRALDILNNNAGNFTRTKCFLDRGERFLLQKDAMMTTLKTVFWMCPAH